MREAIGTYKNGNYRVLIFSDGTKIRYNKEDTLIPSRPESFDILITKSCDLGCNFCLTEETIINVNGKNVPISNVSVGDFVMTYDHKTHENIFCEVLTRYTREYSGDIISIQLESGYVLRCTPNHKVLTKNRGWVRADNITEEDELFD